MASFNLQVRSSLVKGGGSHLSSKEDKPWHKECFVNKKIKWL